MTDATESAGTSEHRTEVDGWQAVWQLDHHCIRMMLVGKVSDATPLMSVAVPTAAPDLAQMRERFPKLSRLWEAVRHEYWAEFLTPQYHSRARMSGSSEGR
ncbi:hypothetical protein D5S18_12245 [Nocardia panacis]|uniref:Uncharacterized protein n=1 Tax=Nocardia panacis TaxID=2340916 RepID=A0A3A4K764_9NOCA|nr:hypothetical protein [Nocardia panacis]RJO76969.1 hypothetical protein D5S18_12245 [Nocardia panacis]